MESQFQTSDKYPIIESFLFRGSRPAFRELILASIVLVLLGLCIVLAALLGRSSVQLQEAHTSALTASNVCRDSACLKAAAHAMALLNASADPCDDFFNFACGGYSMVNPLDSDEVHDNILRQMYDENRKRLEAILQSPVDRYVDWSSERKMKEFYTSCVDDFGREQVKAAPFLTNTMPHLGGWYVLGTWSPGTWDLNEALKRVQTELWLDALWAPTVRVNLANPKTNIIAIFPAGTGYYMQWSYYLDPTKAKIQSDYKQFMRTVAQLLSRDAGVAADQSLADRIEVFVGDAYKVEAQLASIATSARYQNNPYDEAKQVSLNDLTRNTGGVIDWTAQMAYLFNEAGVTGSTKVVLPYPNYVTNLTTLINGLESSSRSRVLHNYLMWRVLENYVSHLSWEYIHANRQMYTDLYGQAEFQGLARYCFSYTEFYFKVALEALYINSHFEEKNKAKVTDITEGIRKALEDMITANTWMDTTTKQLAVDKMIKATYKLGYPDFMSDETRVDIIYAQLTINVSDYFGNLMSLFGQHRRDWNRRLREGEDRGEWLFRVYDTTIAVYWYWDEILLPAGTLQFPIYTYEMPHYHSFGALGTLLGHFVHHLVDEMGRKWDQGGVRMTNPSGWWSNQTLDNYNTVVRQCVVDLYTNLTQGPYVMKNGKDGFVYVNGEKYAGEAIAITTGIRIAYNAYLAWQNSRGQDPNPPGLQYTPQQMFFISHAQTYCYNRDPLYDYNFASRQGITEDTKVNLALSQLPEFSKAFGCQVPAKMAPEKRCTYY